MTEVYDELGKVRSGEDTTPRVWAGCWACYNAGRLVGEWLDVAGDADELGEAVAAMLAGPGHLRAYAGEVHEEHGWFDHEGFEGYRLGEQASFETVATVAAAISEHGAAFAVWFGHESGLDPADFEACYLGRWDSIEDWAENEWEGCGHEHDLEAWRESYLPAPDRYGLSFRYCVAFDAAKYAHEAQVCGEVWCERAGEPDYGVYVFVSQ